ncbi:hypothetical protein EKG37_01430 [Robertmurraya yapensis]|uniref:Uncharacterized protein n=2 Tax=Bacillaceae TaxID=186817 RepID=A0A431WLC8_9BACI|nr:hypothetical protein [Bacillus yapensis]RTR36246.1 hypothetical protein EKG37_01430 [Bacillus yapensis]TKT05749.1 hypothetical protein FAR12_01430 [Bacillus yapensis]
MGIRITIATVDIKVSNYELDLSGREKKILAVLLLNLCAQANAQTIAQDMAMNALEKDAEDIMHFQFGWQSSLSLEKYQAFKAGVERRFKTALQMCEVEGNHITFIENNY